MVKYRRSNVTGGTYFFTLVLRDRKSDLLTKYIKQLGDAMRHVKAIHPYKTIAIVVLPDHMHVMWKLPDHDCNYSLRWRCIKTRFAKNLKMIGVNIVKNASGENMLWQRRFWEHLIRNDKDYERHMDYIHYNPVKHNLVSQVVDWPFSTFHRYVNNGILPHNWCYQSDDLDVG